MSPSPIKPSPVLTNMPSTPRQTLMPGPMSPMPGPMSPMPMPMSPMPPGPMSPMPMPPVYPPGGIVRYGGANCNMNRVYNHPTKWECMNVNKYMNNCNPPFGNDLNSWGVGVLEENPCNGTACYECPSIANIGSINYRVGGYC